MSSKSKEWKLVRGSWIAAEPILPGVWQRKEGGHAVRGRATDQRTGQQKDVWRVLADSSKHEACQWLQVELERIRSGEVTRAPSKTPFASFATSLLKRKIDSGDIQSAAGIEKWENACMREAYPQYFAMTYTGFATGLRPSTLRPIRRKGATPDVDWENGVLLVRRSNARGDIVMDSTKTAHDQEIAIPKELLDVLRWHVDTQLRPGP